jgi:hypothetical protein
MEDQYIIAIPSYKRSSLLNARTLKTLHDLGIPASKIHVFVVEEDKETYETELNREWYGKIVVGVPTIVAQRQFIVDYFTEGQWIISLDDDIESLDLSLTEFKTADEFFRKAFATCVEEEAYLWGIYPVFNEYFRKDRQPVTTSISFVVGAFYGFINRHDDDLKTHLAKNKEDVERSILYYLKDKKIIRFNRIGFKTKYYGSDGGGLGNKKSRLETNKADAVALNETYPDLTRIKIRKDGMYEIVLRPAPPKRVRKPKKATMEIPPLADAVEVDEFPDETVEPDTLRVLPPLPESETAKLLELVKKRQVPKQSQGRGRSTTFGEHRSMTLGLIKGRVTRRYELSYNSKRMPDLYDEVVRVGKLICPFEFQAIHVNHNVQCPRHIDGNNAGKSVIISIGEYEGGSLHVENYGEFITKNHPMVFDGGKNYHWNDPITSGDKYSFVYFSSSNV